MAAPTGIYWVGADNNIYAKAPGGNNAAVTNFGKALNVGNNGFDAQYGSGVFNRVNDPNAPAQSNTSGTTDSASYGSGNPTSSAAAVAAPVYPDKSNDISLQNAGLGAVGDTEKSGIKSIEDAWGKISGQYDDDLNTANTEYGGQSTENTKNLQVNKQAALETGVQGRQGLFGTLASLGALNGTGIERANQAVERGTNEDLTTAGNTYATNQSSLDSGINAYRQQEKRLRDTAENAKNNNEEQVHNDAAKSRQAYLTNLANDYQDEGNTASAKDYSAQAAALFPSIASTNVPTINLGYSGGAYTAPTLSQYTAKANNTSVRATPATGATNSIFAIPGLEALNKKTA